MGCKDIFPDGHKPFYFRYPDVLHPTAISLALDATPKGSNVNPFVADVIYGLLLEIDALRERIRTLSEGNPHGQYQMAQATTEHEA